MSETLTDLLSADSTIPLENGDQIESLNDRNMKNSTIKSTRKILVVRQTLTSKLRMERGNKLLFYQGQLESILNNNPPESSNKKDISKQKAIPKVPLNSVKKHCGSNISSSISSLENDSKIDPKKPATKLKSNLKNPSNTNCMTPSFSRLTQNKSNVDKTNLKPGILKNSVSVAAKKPISKTPSTVVPSKKLSVPQPKHLSVSTITAPKSATIPRSTGNIKRTAPNTNQFSKSRNINTHTEIRKSFAQKKPETQNTKAKEGNKNAPRKSLTSIHFKRVKVDTKDSVFSRTKSMCDIPEVKKLKIISPIIEVDESFEFKTPMSMQRRSLIFATPSSTKSCFSPYPTYSTYVPNDMIKKLDDWLKRKGKSIGSYHHLKCFNLAVSNPLLEESFEDDENKENIEVLDGSSESYKELNIAQEVNEADKNEDDLFVVAKDALYDLHKLILEGYCRDQCETWLEMIKNKCPNIVEHSQYWECKASLEEIRGDFSSAVDCYQQAIIKGAELKEMENSLDNLLQKFCVLNLSPKAQVIFKDAESKKRTKTILDARNIFKSCIINFAISKQNQKSEKENDCKYLATPVRRSTRHSRSSYTTTPGVTLCTSLNNLDSPTRKSLHFQTNKAL